MITTSDIRPLSQSTETTAQTAAHHEHAWAIESRHRTSEGTVLYVWCESCRARRIDLQRRYDAPPAALSNPIVVAATADPHA